MVDEDDPILAEMNKQIEDPRKRRQVAPPEANSQFSEKDLQNKVRSGKVWVKCISENQPWADEKTPMEFWKDYLVSVSAAIALDKKRFSVILVPPTQASKGES